MNQLTLITCHANADFDAFAAILAARHLYSPCLLLFPGSQEKSLQSLYAELEHKTYGFVGIDEIDWDKVTRLVLVDTRQKGRVRHVDKILGRADLVIEVWDHHPDSPDDLAADQVNLCKIGAVTSLLVEQLEKKEIKISPEEATLLGLGIYSDTGSFTFSSTTRQDFNAAAWLLEQGMNVNQISDLAANELTSLHVHALNSLLESVQTYTVNKTEIAIAEASMEHYLGDFAVLAHRLMEMEKFNVLFAIGIMEDCIQVVARSRSNAINVGNICSALGGGGHVYAASASIRSMPVNAVRETILRSLFTQATPDKTAQEYMSSPAVGIAANAKISEADELMLHFGLKAVPVFAPNTRECTGLLDAQTASRATSHGLGSMPVEDYMQRRFATLPPNASLQEILEIIINGRQRLIPIVENHKVTGVVTRTDMMNIFTDGVGHLPENRQQGKERNVAKFLQDRLDAKSRKLLSMAGDLGRRLAMPVYAVGGFVRDLLANRHNQDIDLVVEGDGLTFARALAAELGGRVGEHQKFLTSVVIFTDEENHEKRIDVATARLEYYEYPAAMPTVELSSIKMDLYRRDFSINAMAVRLDCSPYGQLVDFFGGQRDLRDKVIRVIHTLSFVEDPTRCLRAVRFEQRYKFRIGHGTERLIKNAVSLQLMDRLSGPRLFHEYMLICQEENPQDCFERLDELGILKAIWPRLALNPARRALLGQIREMQTWYNLLYFEEKHCAWLPWFLALNHGSNYSDTVNCYRRLGLPEAQRAWTMSQRELLRNLGSKLEKWQKEKDTGTANVSQLCYLLKPVAIECLLYLMAATANPGLQKNLSRYITKWRNMKTDIGGADLLRIGLKPGPDFGRILKAVLVAKLDGVVTTAESQIMLARQLSETKGGDPAE